MAETVTAEEVRMLLELAERADKAAPGGWFAVGPPWLPRDAQTYIIAGSYDPHVGIPVCDFNDAGMCGVEDKYEDDDWTARNDLTASFITNFDPPTVIKICRALLASIEGKDNG